MRHKKNALTDNHIISPLLFCAGGVIINLLFNQIVNLLGLPIVLYLDTIGTVVISVMGGYLPGAVVGLVTNIVLSISTPVALYYAIINVMIAVIAAFFSEKKKLDKAGGIIGLSLSLTFAAGLSSALIPWFMNGLSLDSESLSSILRKTGIFDHMSPMSAHILSTLFINIIDKSVTVVIALIICRLIPEKYRSLFRFTVWRQKPMSDEQLNENNSSEVKGLSLRIKILIVLVISLSTVAVVGTAISVRVYYKTMINEHTAIAKGTAKFAAIELSGDKIKGITTDGGNSEEYRESKRMLEELLYNSPEIAYLYVYRMEEDGFHVVFDIDTEDTPAAEIGTVIPYDEGFEPYIPQLLAGENVEPIITNDEYGYLLTAAEPVFDSDGNCACYAIADVDIQQLIKNRRSFLTEMITVFLSFLIIICVFVIWLANYHIIYPLKSITIRVDKITKSGDTQEILDKDVKKIRNIAIQTGDEIEQLYRSICSMTLSQSEQVRSIRRLSDSTAKMQDGLIVTMADMVENRDSDTGAHIQKTAAYVKIIVEKLKEKGYYAEKITPKFMSDVVRSAPLHDVGKINIPDCVLNKPGRLTDEEYEIMKTHTTVGRKIMDHAIISVEGDSYLNEARNMAASHHERWDGKGYPEGLHGEVIPLSARIMAVADVFDALTSPRVYKPAFSMSKALSIIEEGKGTQFDPKCVEAFMDSLDEVTEVLRKYNPEVLD